MIPRKSHIFAVATQVLLLFVSLPGISSLEVNGKLSSIVHKERLGDGEPKFGESPTNRVLPVDHLSQADYEDEDIQDYENADGIRDYCTRLMRLELMNAIKPDKRTGRQAEDAESLGLLGSYLDLDFDPVKVVGPLLNIMGSAAARNATSIDENYKKLPPFFKLQVTDFIQVFKSLLSTTDI